MQQQCEMLQVGHAQRLGSLPVGLVPLPASKHQLPASGCRPPPIALVLAERPCVVRRQPGTGFNVTGCIQSLDASASCYPEGASSEVGGGSGGGGVGGAGFPAQGLPTAEAVCAPRLARGGGADAACRGAQVRAFGLHEWLLVPWGGEVSRLHSHTCCKKL